MNSQGLQFKTNKINHLNLPGLNRGECITDEKQHVM